MEDRLQLDIIITPEGEGEEKIFSISSVQIPNIVTQGRTEQEAKQRLIEALKLYFEEMPEEKQRLIQTIKVSQPPMISRILI